MMVSLVQHQHVHVVVPVLIIMILLANPTQLSVGKTAIPTDVIVEHKKVGLNLKYFGVVLKDLVESYVLVSFLLPANILTSKAKIKPIYGLNSSKELIKKNENTKKIIKKLNLFEDFKYK